MEVAQPGNPAGESALLRCLTVLNDDVLAAYLLPKLVEQESAAAVALSCSQLRRLCQLSTQHLVLSQQLQDADNPCSSAKLARQLVAAFPNCTSLDFAWASSSLVNVSRSITPLLAGLPHLSTLSIKLSGSSHSGDLDPVLCQMHVHATGLRCLSLQLSTGWADQTDKSWASLGRMTNLTRLQLTFHRLVTNPCSLNNLQPLTGLTKLKSLIIEAPNATSRRVNPDDAGLWLAAQQFPGRLTSLTQLWLPLRAVHDLSSVSECVALCDLRILANAYPMCSKWGAQPWAALVQLTSLTCLHVDLDLDEGDKGDSEAFFGVLRQLTDLRSVGAAFWGPSCLPQLQSLTHVTAVHGAWYQAVTNEVDEIAVPPLCPHIKALGRTVGAQYQAFPGLVSVELSEVYIDNLDFISRYCTGLQRLVLADPDSCETDDDASQAERLAVFRSLGHLQHLTHLDLAPRSDAELVAFTSAAAAVSTPHLQCMRVYTTISYEGMVTVHALMQLQSVRGLKELLVHLGDVEEFVWSTFTTEAVRMWLVGLAVVPKVYLVLGDGEQQGVFEAARQWVAEMELPLPAVLKISLAK